VAITFKQGFAGAPYFRCIYTGTTFTEYEFYLVSAGPGHWLHKKVYYHGPYIPIPLGAG
jgi:hypothetical protein